MTDSCTTDSCTTPEQITQRLAAISRQMHELAAERNRLLELRLRLSIVPARTDEDER